ncbi:hypothetical protein QYM36_001575 [Artemia franciscana]|uniref:Uncharacterized protein n=1 Tax=Artemia franciscana TaxID=6661 RepID=A0AA88LIN3_ARTSF|nr:hypothetical protein QYM36_001575 [Artemia franciscana]
MRYMVPLIWLSKGVLGPRVAPGPPDRQKTCRVCVRNLFSSEDSVPYFVCSKCGLKVCDDCASYSSRISHNDLYIRPASQISIWLQKTNENEVSKGISGTKNISAGSYLLSLRVLKEIFPVIKDNLVEHIDGLFKDGNFPQPFKIAK